MGRALFFAKGIALKIVNIKKLQKTYLSILLLTDPTVKINKTHIEAALAQGETGEAIKMMLALLKANDGSDYNNILHQSAAYHGLEKDIRLGIVSDNNVRMIRARINHSLNHYLDNLKPEWEVAYDLPAARPAQPDAPAAPPPASPPPDAGQKVILCLSANPVNTDRLSTEVEFKKIKQAIQMSPGNDAYRVVYEPAVTVAEFRTAILVNKPAIVHFSGHGSPAGKIMLHDERERSKEIEPAALGNFFSIIRQAAIPLECVVLNACYSKVQAEEIHKSIDTVIGMSNKVGDTAAIAFAQTFYGVLGTSQPYKIAFLLGCNDIDLNGLDGEDTPKIFER